MSDSHLDLRLKRMGAAYRQETATGVGEDARLPVGTIKQAMTAYQRFWARRGMEAPSERHRGRGSKVAGRGPA